MANPSLFTLHRSLLALHSSPLTTHLLCSFLLLVSRKNGINARNEPNLPAGLPAEGMAGREKDGLGFQRPTNGSIPKPDKPFAPAFYCLIVFHFFNPGLTSPSGF